jgi:alginate O-acetyltransferase complex protein AlgI
MVFSSLLFLFAYLPTTLAIYYAVPCRARNAVLFAVSLFFYGWGEPITIFIMLVSITSAYLFGFLIEKYKEKDKKRAKAALIASLAVSLFILLFFKYYNFFAVNLSRLPLVRIPQIMGLRLPIGISFYTFQIMSYTIDLYRSDCKLQKNYVSFGAYVTLFPQLIAGPIVRYNEIDRQLTERRENWSDFSEGVERFCCGLAKKILIGDSLAFGHRYFRELAAFSPTALGGWLTVIFYTLHLYYDFSGYSDMAIGLGKMFGFRFPENFRYPYVSQSITEFWRRWHISLSAWFREYVYIPLGGNRHGRFKQYRNLAIVWLLTGFWHGAGWNFILWGVYYAILLIFEKAFLLKILEKTPTALRHFYTMTLVVIGFLIFSFADLLEGSRCFFSLFGGGCVGFSTDVVTYQLLRFLPLLLLAVVGATPMPQRIYRNFLQRNPHFAILAPILTVGVLFLCVVYLVDSTFSPFAYLQF